MTAAVRSVQATTWHGGTSPVPRGAARPGDLLIAFQSADSGSHGVLALSGGWQLAGEHIGGGWPGEQGGIWSGTKVWTREATADEPASYTATQGVNADGVVIVVAVAGAVAGSVQVAAGTGNVAPSLTPSGASGLELRHSAGVPALNGGSGATITWGVPAGTTKLVAAQSSTWVSAVVASRPISSTSPVGEATFAPTGTISTGALTVLIASAETEAPAPPIVQPYAPGRGSSLYRFVFTRLRDRTYLGDLDLVNVSFDKRILQPGSFQATIPIPNRRVGDQVAEIIPRDETDLGIGPGVITCQVFRDGVCWGEYWITKAVPSRSRSGTPAIALTGSTLDAYLNAVEIQDDLFYAGDDQIAIARSLLNHLMSRTGANLSLNLQPGVSGVERDRTYLDSEGGRYGQRLVELAQVDGGFEWTINLDVDGGSLLRRWVWGYPTLGTLDPPPHLFSDGRNGGDILEWSEEIDALRGATRWRARGSSSTGDASTTGTPLVSSVVEASAYLAAGWPRIDRTLSYSTVTDAGTLDDYAAFWAATAPGALRVHQATVTFGKNPSLTPNHLGDAARLYLDNEWHRGVWRTHRVIGIGVTPPSRSGGKEEARLVLEGAEVPGA
ncbi:hypothetical protein [Nonomuraea wenchangensis]|uniref:hypothetical protein n=1 Tax=Nonomuraea wenchangensis TaxID=568860 RepID=UPI00332A5E2E